MKLVPVSEFTDRLWYDAHLTMFNRDLAFHMGTDPRMIANPPSLVDFYENIMQKVEQDTFNGWAIVRKDDYVGHIIADKGTGEWEIGGVLRDKKDWGSGIGVLATLKGLRWIFEEKDSQWAIAFTQGKDPKVREMLLRGGFQQFMHFQILARSTWDERWAGRVK